MKEKNTFIYGLFSKNDYNTIRYIGKSDNPSNRLKKHIYNTKFAIKRNCKLTHKDHWIIKNNFEIEYVILEECSYKLWPYVEIKHINKYDGLTNTASGGKGGCTLKYKLSYNEVKHWVISNMVISSKTKWSEYIRNNELPIFIPKNPREVYVKRGWISWGDFLGTGRKWDNNVSYLTYDESKRVISTMGIKSDSDFKSFVKCKLIINEIPNRPNRYYKNRGWISWGDFLGTGRVANQLKQFLTLDQLKIELRNMNITRFSDYKKYIKSEFRDSSIPTNPNVTYKNDGWTSWADLFK